MSDYGYLEATRCEFRRLRSVAELAMAQLDDDLFFHAPAPETNSVAILVKHVAGNLLSRWTDLLETDGEKPDRDRDAEFEIRPGDDRPSLIVLWAAGWDRALETLDALEETDLDRTVRVRGERLTVVEAIQRQLGHAAGHVGQIVYAARLLRGSDWMTLSIPRGGSKAFNESIGFDPYRPA
jgi:hypothetical protein